MAASSQSMSALPANRRGLVAQWFALIGAAIAVAAIVALIVTWPSHGDNSVPAAGPSPAVAKHATPASASADTAQPASDRP